MSNTNDIARDKAKQLQAMRLAEMKLTDKPDMQDCVKDVQAYTNLDADEARIVAASFRAKMLPAFARQSGISEERIAQILDQGDPMTADFANDTSSEDDQPTHFHHAPQAFGDDAGNDGGMDASDDLDGGLPSLPMKKKKDEISDEPDDLDQSGLGEADDSPSDAVAPGMVKIQVEIPADALDAFKEALDQAMGGHSDDGDDLNNDAPSGPSDLDDGLSNSDNGDDSGADGDDINAGPDDSADDTPPAFGKAAGAARRTVMSDTELAQRAAKRQAILASINSMRTAADDDGQKRDIGLGKDTSEGTYGGAKPSAFQFNADAQPKNVETLPRLTLENSGGNSLQGQNPTYAKQDIPTNNPDLLQLSTSYNVVKKDGTPDGTLEYEVDTAKVDFIPSGQARDGKEFAVPTQMSDTLPFKTTIAATHCQGCTNTARYAVHLADCESCGKRVAICEQCENDGYCPSCAANARLAADNDADGIDEGVTDSGETKRRKGVFDGTEMPQSDRNTKKPFEKKDPNEGSEKVSEVISHLQREAAIDKARVRTAYSTSFKLALAGLLQPNEVDSNAEMYLSSGMSNEMMVKQAGMWLRSAQGAAERVASRYAETSVRTASTQGAGIATNPLPYGRQTTSNPAAMDLQQALKGLWTTPKIGEE